MHILNPKQIVKIKNEMNATNTEIKINPNAKNENNSYKQKIKEELNELAERLAKLIIAELKGLSNKISEAQMKLIKKQKKIMEQYCQVLTERLEEIEEENC